MRMQTIAVYEVMVLGDNRFQSLATQIKHFPALPHIDTNWVMTFIMPHFAFAK